MDCGYQNHQVTGSGTRPCDSEWNPAVIVDTLERDHIDILFCIGGDGTLRGAHAIATEALDRAEGLITVPCYEWTHVAVAPLQHPLAKMDRPTLDQLDSATFPRRGWLVASAALAVAQQP